MEKITNETCRRVIALLHIEMKCTVKCNFYSNKLKRQNMK